MKILENCCHFATFSEPVPKMLKEVYINLFNFKGEIWYPLQELNLRHQV